MPTYTMSAAEFEGWKIGDPDVISEVRLSAYQMARADRGRTQAQEVVCDITTPTGGLVGCVICRAVDFIEARRAYLAKIEED